MKKFLLIAIIVAVGFFWIGYNLHKENGTGGSTTGFRVVEYNPGVASSSWSIFTTSGTSNATSTFSVRTGGAEEIYLQMYAQASNTSALLYYTVEYSMNNIDWFAEDCLTTEDISTYGQDIVSHSDAECIHRKSIATSTTFGDANYAQIATEAMKVLAPYMRFSIGFSTTTGASIRAILKESF